MRGQWNSTFPYFTLVWIIWRKWRTLKRSQCRNVKLQGVDFNGQSMATFVGRPTTEPNNFASPICVHKPSIMYEVILSASLKQYIFTRTKLDSKRWYGSLSKFDYNAQPVKHHFVKQFDKAVLEKSFHSLNLAYYYNIV